MYPIRSIFVRGAPRLRRVITRAQIVAKHRFRQRGARVGASGLGLTAALFLCQHPASLESSSNSDTNKNGAAKSQERPQTTIELPFDLNEAGLQMGIGSVCGFASGYALKKVGKVTAVVFGLGFIGFQIARHQGLVENPDWQRIEKEITRRLDADGDGKITNADLRHHYHQVVEFLGFGLPSGAAFAGGFFLGIKLG
eukprot:gb/GECG01014742.1/.p1 GENE.gb/GECG01014742.1/~~gb/GECG01014742.1/.p1  ORF type:complete len:197 (+),score=16.47 gb/GECG01014742.1/:1-591(+)